MTVFDLPEVIEHVTCVQPEGRRTDRIRFVPGRRVSVSAVSHCSAALVCLCRGRCASVCVTVSMCVCVCLHMCISVCACRCVCCLCVCVLSLRVCARVHHLCVHMCISMYMPLVWMPTNVHLCMCLCVCVPGRAQTRTGVVCARAFLHVCAWCVCSLCTCTHGRVVCVFVSTYMCVHVRPCVCCLRVRADVYVSLRGSAYCPCACTWFCVCVRALPYASPNPANRSSSGRGMGSRHGGRAGGTWNGRQEHLRVCNPPKPQKQVPQKLEQEGLEFDVRDNFQEGQPSMWGQLEMKPFPPRIWGNTQPQGRRGGGPGAPRGRVWGSGHSSPPHRQSVPSAPAALESDTPPGSSRGRTRPGVPDGLLTSCCHTR